MLKKLIRRVFLQIFHFPFYLSGNNSWIIIGYKLKIINFKKTFVAKKLKFIWMKSANASKLAIFNIKNLSYGQNIESIADLTISANLKLNITSRTSFVSSLLIFS